MKAREKPAGACYACRARRIKCDETRPSCYKCGKTERVCPGYKDDRQLRVRDMTAKTIRKYSTQKDTSDTAAPRRSGSEAGPSSNMAASKDPPIAPAPQPVSPTLNQRSMDFLFKHFLSGSGGYNDLGFLIPFLRAKSLGPCLSPSVSAVALAALSTQDNTAQLRWEAGKYYLHALSEMKKAVATPAGFEDERVLAAALTLCVYETLVSSTIEPLLQHINGVSAIVVAQAKRPETLQGPLSTELLRVAKTELIKAGSIKFLLSKTIQDGWLDDLENCHLESKDDTPKLLDILAHRPPLFLEALDSSYIADWFRGNSVQQNSSHRSHTASPAPTGHPSALRIVLDMLVSNVSDCEWPDEQYQRSMKGVVVAYPSSPVFPILWMFYPETPNFYYRDVASFKSSMSLVSARLLHYHLITRLAKRIYPGDSYKNSSEYNLAATYVPDLLHQVIGSTPFVCAFDSKGYDLQREDYDTTPDGLGATVTNFLPIIFSAIQSDFVTDPQRQYLTAMLSYIAERRGVSQAQAFLDACVSGESSSTPTTTEPQDTMQDISNGLRVLSSLRPLDTVFLRPGTNAAQGGL